MPLKLHSRFALLFIGFGLCFASGTPVVVPVFHELDSTIPASDPLTDAQKKLVAEHAQYGIPSEGKFYVRNAYIMGFDKERRIPSWVSYHVTKDYCEKKPKREGRFKGYLNDPDITGEALTGNTAALILHRVI